jgi:hypothetical protein
MEQRYPAGCAQVGEALSAFLRGAGEQCRQHASEVGREEVGRLSASPGDFSILRWMDRGAGICPVNYAASRLKKFDGRFVRKYKLSRRMYNNRFRVGCLDVYLGGGVLLVILLYDE